MKRNLLILIYPFYRMFNAVRKTFFCCFKPQLRVLLYHDISPKDFDKFRKQLIELSRSWDFITPEKFLSVIRSEEFIKKDSLLITFDDGYLSNKLAAEKILDPLGIKGLFFIVTNFLNIKTLEESQKFIASHIIPGADPLELPDHLRNMEPVDLYFLLKSGHAIGAHTLNHARLSGISGLKLHHEVVGGANKLEKIINKKITCFAYTFGDVKSFSKEAYELSVNQFQFIFTGLSGNNLHKKNPFIIRRDAVNPTDPPYLVAALLGGCADWFFWLQLRKLEQWLSIIK